MFAAEFGRRSLGPARRVRTAHLADASGWGCAGAGDDGEGEPRCGYVPISHLGGAVSPRFFQDEASEVS